MANANKKKNDKKKGGKKKESYITYLVRQHNEHPSGFVKFLRNNYARVAAATVLGSVVAAAAGVPFAQKFFHLSYETKTADGEVLYGSGNEDFYILFFFSTFLTLMRAVVDVPFKALARYAKVEEAELPKFADMGWQFMYYLTAWSTGMTLYYHSSWGNCPQVGIWSGMLGGAVCGFDDLWENIPHFYLTASFKWYYMLQTSFWIHQLFIMSVELWRKDFHLYYIHHFITIGLLASSYCMGFHHIGTAVLVEQDFADIFLPIAKLLHYAHIEPIDTVFFALFALAWITTRHILYFFILHSVATVDPIAISNGTYGHGTQNVFVVVLVLFQCLLMMWLKELIHGIIQAVKDMGKITDHREVKAPDSKTE